MAKKTTVAATEQKLEGFAEDLGTLLASATNKAEGWLEQRKAIVKHLTDVRDTASKLLADLGDQASTAVATGKRAYIRRGRPAAKAVVNKLRGVATETAALVRPRRKMSAKARKAISVAQKARWAKQKALTR
jgi:hypothetical protein